MALWQRQLHTKFAPETPPSLFPAPVRSQPKPVPSQRRNSFAALIATIRRSLRRSFQAAFLLLNVWIGGIFYFWVRQFEPGGAPTSLQRPAGVEGWLPIAGADEPPLLRADSPCARAASGGNVSADLVSCHVVPVSQSLLQLALPGRNDFGIPVARGTEACSAAIFFCRAGSIFLCAD